MAAEIKGLENSFPVRLIYVNNRLKKDEHFKSLAAASRKTGIKAQTIKESLNPVAKKRFDYENEVIVFRVVREK